MFLRQAYHLFGYYLTLVFFAAFGLALGLFALLAGCWPTTERTERFFQRLIHRNLALFLWWADFARLLHVRYHGFQNLPTGGQVVAANHPGLMDATYLLARLSEVVCIFKPAIRGNPVLGAAARRAGYIASDGGSDLVREASDKLAAGRTLLIFPEGTRTVPGSPMPPLKPGFVLMARRAAVPIQLVRISWDSNVLAKGQAWWKLPRLPGRVDVTLGPRVKVDAGDEPAVLAARIQAWFNEPAADNAACTGVLEALPSPARLPAPS